MSKIQELLKVRSNSHNAKINKDRKKAQDDAEKILKGLANLGLAPPTKKGGKRTRKMKKSRQQRMTRRR